MTNRNSKWISAAACSVACSGAVAMFGLLGGCSGEEPQQQVVAPPPPGPPPPPPAPKVTPIEQLMAELNIDPRIHLPEERAPDNDADRKAVLVFFDAIARGNAQSLRGMLPLADQLELNALVESGTWQETVSGIQSVDIQTGMNSLSQKCALAVIEVGAGADLTFQPQLWYYTTEEEQALFEAAPTPPGIMDRLHGSDWIAAWHQILAEELAMADRPDEDLERAQKSLEEEEDDKKSSSGSQPAAPRGGGGPAPLRDPSGPKTPAPGNP